jgi:hypothetical protein
LPPPPLAAPRSGLLLQLNPDGITENKVLFSVIVGGLTTSIVGFTLWLFLREMWNQLVTSLLELQDEEDDEAAAAALDAELEEEEEAYGHDEAELEKHHHLTGGGGGDSDADSVQHAWHDGEEGGTLALEGVGGGEEEVLALPAPPGDEDGAGDEDEDGDAEKGPPA